MPVRAAIAVYSLLTAAGALASPDPREVLERFRSDHAGVAYRFGACSRTRMDCSCFVQRLYRDHLDLELPRSTLAQVRSMRFLRVRSIRRSAQLTAESLCVGDLIYTYRGASWVTGRRHVVVYAGDGRVLHSSSSLGGVGLSPLSWVRGFALHGVYRPLGC